MTINDKTFRLSVVVALVFIVLLLGALAFDHIVRPVGRYSTFQANESLHFLVDTKTGRVWFVTNPMKSILFDTGGYAP